MDISERLKQCDSAESVKNFTEQLTCKIGIFGGRRFYMQNQAGSVCLNDVVKRLQEIFEAYQKTSEDDDLQKKVDETLEFSSSAKKLEYLDSNANKKLEESSIFQRIFTAVKQWFGNWGYNRKKVLDGMIEAYKKCQAEKVKVRREEIFNDFVTACGGTKKYEALPILDLQGNVGDTGYIDFIRPGDMTAPVMRFQDRLGRRGFAVCGRRNNDRQDRVQTFFERYPDWDSWTDAGFPNLISMGSSGHFVSDGVVDDKTYTKVKTFLGGLVNRDEDEPLDSQAITDLITEVEAG